MVSCIASAPPASAGLSPSKDEKAHTDKASGTKLSTKAHTDKAPATANTHVAFAEKEQEGFEIPSVEEILAREEDPAMFDGFTRSLPSSATQVCLWHCPGASFVHAVQHLVAPSSL